MPYANKEDRRAQLLRWRENNPERAREIKKKSQIKHWAKRKTARAQAILNPELRAKNLAQYRFRFAVKRGCIKRPRGKDFHHTDYSRPYYGAWVTPLEHRRIHAAMVSCPKCVDYEEQVNEFRENAIRERNHRGALAANKKRWGKR